MNTRLYALDNLRAVMMWLGVVLHVAVIYMVAPSPLPWHDNQSSELADLLVALIHSFRMPVFFILAGFFVTMLVQRRGVRGMLKNRLMRLGLPFVLLWPVIYVACVVLALLFVHRMVRGTWGLDVEPDSPARRRAQVEHHAPVVSVDADVVLPGHGGAGPAGDRPCRQRCAHGSRRRLSGWRAAPGALPCWPCPWRCWAPATRMAW